VKRILIHILLHLLSRSETSGSDLRNLKNSSVAYRNFYFRFS